MPGSQHDCSLWSCDSLPTACLFACWPVGFHNASMAPDQRFQAALSYSLTLVCVSSLKGRGRSSRCSGPGVRFRGVPGRSWACVTRSRCPGAAPAAQRVGCQNSAMASDLRLQAAASYWLTLVCVSSLKGRGRSSRCSGPGVRFRGVPGRSWACVTRSRCPGAAPAAQRGRTDWTPTRMARY